MNETERNTFEVGDYVTIDPQLHTRREIDYRMDIVRKRGIVGQVAEITPEGEIVTIFRRVHCSTYHSKSYPSATVYDFHLLPDELQHFDIAPPEAPQKPKYWRWNPNGRTLIYATDNLEGWINVHLNLEDKTTFHIGGVWNQSELDMPRTELIDALEELVALLKGGAQ